MKVISGSGPSQRFRGPAKSLFSRSLGIIPRNYSAWTYRYLNRPYFEGGSVLRISYMMQRQYASGHKPLGEITAKGPEVRANPKKHILMTVLLFRVIPRRA